MVLSNAQRQALYRKRLKAAATRGAHSTEAWQRAERIITGLEKAVSESTDVELGSRPFRDLMASELRALRIALGDIEAALAIEGSGAFYKP